MKHLVKEVFDQRAGSGINNSISCVDFSVSCFENLFGLLGGNEKVFVKVVF